MASSTCSMAVTRTPLQMQAPRRAASVAALPARRTLRVVAAQQKNQAAAPVMATALLTTAAAFAASPAAQAAQEAFQVAEGEPLIVILGWCATAAMFSFSLAMVVWGRSGL